MLDKYIIDNLQKIANDTILENIASNNGYIHNKIQENICKWAISNNYYCKKEFKVSSRDESNTRSGRIDLKLIINNKSILIEIDSSPRKKSIYKLNNNYSDYKIWLYCKNNKFNSFIQNNKELNNLILIPILPYKELVKLEKIKIQSNCFNVLKETEDYIIVDGMDKVAGIIKNPMAMSDIIDNLSDELLKYEYKTKELYTHINLNDIDMLQGIEYMEIPKELLRQIIKRLRLI